MHWREYWRAGREGGSEAQRSVRELVPVLVPVRNGQRRRRQHERVSRADVGCDCVPDTDVRCGGLNGEVEVEVEVGENSRLETRHGNRDGDRDRKRSRRMRFLTTSERHLRRNGARIALAATLNEPRRRARELLSQCACDAYKSGAQAEAEAESSATEPRGLTEYE